MINLMALKLVNYLSKISIIEEDEKELYSYGFFILISRMLFFMFSTIIGIMFNIIIESILFYIFFSIIRVCAGGIHASSEISCAIFTSLSLFGSIVAIKLMMKSGMHIFDYIVLFCLFVCIVFYSPLDTKEKSLSDKEKKYFKLKSFIVSAIIVLISIVAATCGNRNIFCVGFMSLLLESVLLVFGKIKFILK